jgi:hypothetical protein
LVVALQAVLVRVVVLQTVVRQTVVLLVVAPQAVVLRVNTRVIGGREVEAGQPDGRETGLSELGEWPRIRAPQRAQDGTLSMLRAAQARNGLAQPQPRAAYSSLRLQSRVLRSQSGNGIWRGQDSGVSILVYI